MARLADLDPQACPSQIGAAHQKPHCCMRACVYVCVSVSECFLCFPVCGGCSELDGTVSEGLPCETAISVDVVV